MFSLLLMLFYYDSRTDMELRVIELQDNRKARSLCFLCLDQARPPTDCETLQPNLEQHTQLVVDGWWDLAECFELAHKVPYVTCSVQLGAC